MCLCLFQEHFVHTQYTRLSDITLNKLLKIKTNCFFTTQNGRDYKCQNGSQTVLKA